MLRGGIVFATALLLPAAVLSKASFGATSRARFPTKSTAHGVLLSLRGGEDVDKDSDDYPPTNPFTDSITVGPSLKTKILLKYFKGKAEQPPPDSEEDDELASPNLEYWKPPMQMDMLQGETKEGFAVRLQESFGIGMDDDEYKFVFYERFWPAYKANKRLRAAMRNELLAQNFKAVFDQDEATNASWFVPYSEPIRAELGSFPNVTAFCQEQLPKTDFKDPSHSPEHALWEACQRGAGDEEIFDLAAKVEDIDAQDETQLNWNAAHYAAERGHVQVIEVLGALKADVWAKDQEGNTPLAIASERGHARVVDVIQDIVDADFERAYFRSLPPDPPAIPRRTTPFEKIFFY